MWRPPERIKHALLPSRWPHAEEAAAALWFQPLRVGRLAVEERTWVPAMVPWRATDDGLVTEDVLAWYERFARGAPGVIVVEATGVREVASGPLLRIGHDRFLPGLSRLVETVRKASGGRTRLFIQVIDFLSIRRRPERDKYLRRFLELTDSHRRACAGSAGDDEVRARLVALPDEELERVLSAREFEALQFGARERVTDLHVEAIRDLPRQLPNIFAAAAVRAEAAGFDGVELHYAHAYTLASFLSARNDRSDGYGGTLAGRVRLPLEVLGAVRASVADRFVVGCRLLSEDCIEGGSSVEDVEFFCVELARAGVDFLSLSRGGKFEDAQQPAVGWAAYPYTGPSGWECMPTSIADARGPFGRNLEPAARIRAAVRAAGFATPVVVAGGIHTFDQAETILREEKADLVAAARQTLADPDWFRKVRLGRGSEVRRCTFTNYCEALDQKHKQVTCKLWDRLELQQPAVQTTADGARRLVAPAWEP
jgi:2,4-dienoyl-CoA reductase-like NADH-dependent reductase (Old Yellow Enzyme family)